MKNNQKLNEAFADIDGAFVEKASTPPKKSAMPLYIAIACAIVVFAIGSAIVLPALFTQDPTKTLPPAISDGSPTQSEKPTPSDKPTPTPVEKPSLTPTPSKEPTPTPTPTPVPTPTPTPTPTPIPTPTPEPTPTPTPEPLPTPSTDNSAPVFEVPDWYIPGNLSVLSLTRLASTPKASSAIRATAPASASTTGKPTNQTLTLNESSGAMTVLGGRYVNLSYLSQSSEHSSHGCMIYDMQENKMVCYACLLKELPLDPMKEGEILVIDAMTTAQLISFAVYDNPQNTITARYIYEPEKELLRKVPLLSTQDFGIFNISPDGSYLMTAASRAGVGDYYDYFLIDTETLTPKALPTDYRTSHSRHFSPDGKTLFIVLRNEDGSTNMGTDKVKYLMVDVKTGAYTLCEGMILSYANGQVVTRNRTTYHVYDRSTATEIEIPEGTYAFETRQGQVLRINVKTGKEEVLTTAPDAWQLSSDGLYAYAYNTGENFLTVYSLETGESFKVAVASEFAKTVKELSNTKDLRYSISLSDKMDELLICYSLSKKTTPPTVSIWSATKDAFLESNSIIDFVLKFEELYKTSVAYKVYKGEGFTHLYIDGSTLVEDYRTGTFTMYSDEEYLHAQILDTGFIIEEERIVLLNSSEKETDAFLERRGLEAGVATVDYADFYVDGKFSRFKAQDFITTPEYMNLVSGFRALFDHTSSYTVTDKTHLSIFMAELHACEKTFTPGTSFDESKVNYQNLDLFYPSSYHTTSIWAGYCTKGVYRIQAGGNEYFVPEYVYADFITLLVYDEFNKRSHTLTEGKNMTVEDLRALYESGISPDALSPFAYRTLTNYSGKLRLLIPVYEGEQQLGYAYVGFDKEGKVTNLTLFDTNYRYVAFPAIDGLPEGEWIYKGHIPFKAD